MRVKDFINMYCGKNRVEVEIVNGKLRLIIRGCE